MDQKYLNEHEKEFLKIIRGFSRHDTTTVFHDFVQMLALNIRQALEPKNRREFQKRFRSYDDKYKHELKDLHRMYMSLILAMEKYALTKEYVDVMGHLMQALEIKSKDKGQFSTPDEIGESMSRILISKEEILETVDKYGYFYIGEPCCGAGGLILSAIRQMVNEGINPCKNLLVYAMDIDLNCACITYIQLSLYGIPAIVEHGNALSQEIWGRWYTPVYIIDGWDFRVRMRKKQEENEKKQQ